MPKRAEMLRISRGFTAAELSRKINEQKKKLIDLDQQKLLGKLKNVSEIGQLRKEIARLLTLRDEKLIAELKKEDA